MDIQNLIDQRDVFTSFLNWRDSNATEDAVDTVENLDFALRNVSNIEINRFLAELNLAIASYRLGRAVNEFLEAVQFAGSV